MRIWYLSNCVSSKKLAGYLEKYGNNIQQQVQKYNRLLVEGLQKNGAFVTCVSSRPINRSLESKIFFKREIETERRIRYDYLPFINAKYVRNISLFIGTFISVLKQKKGTTVICDALNLTMAIACIMASHIKRLTNIAIVTDVPCHRPKLTAPSKTEKLGLRVMQMFDSYLLLTEAMNELVNPHNKPYVVLEGHGDVEMREVPNDLSGKSFPRVCLYAGTLRSIYGIENLVNGFIKADLKDTELHIYGRGDFENRLVDICKTHPNVKYLGVAPNQVIVEEEIKATLLVNPRPTGEEYTKYSFPSKNMEYMASGTPVLTTKLPGMPREYYAYVYTIDQEDEEGIKEKLQAIFASDPVMIHQVGLDAKDFIIKEKNNVVQAKKMMEALIGEDDCKRRIQPKIHRSIPLFDFLCVLYLMHTYLPIVGLYTPSVVFGLLTLVVFFGCFRRIACYASSNLINFFLPMFFISLLFGLKYIISFDIVGLVYYLYSFLQTYLYGLIAITYIVMGNQQRMNRIMAVVLVCFSITCVTTIIGCYTFSSPSRILATLSMTDTDYTKYVSHNIGGFSFVYGSVLLVPTIRVFISKHKMSRVPGILLIALIGYMVFLSEYTLAFFAYVLTVIFMLVRKLTFKKILLVLAIIFAIVFIATPLFTGILDILIQNDESGMRTARFQYVIELLEGNSSYSTMDSGDRLELYVTSLKLFITSHGLGIWSSTGIGGHSYIFDNMAIFGFLGIFLMVVSYVFYYERVIRNVMKASGGGYLLWGFLLVNNFAFLNPKDNMSYLIFIVPLTASVAYGMNFTGSKTILTTEAKGQFESVMGG